MNTRLRQLFLYAGTAGTAAVVDIGGFAVLNGFGVSLGIAAATSFLVATVFNYLLTARFVFGSDIHWRGYMRFLSAASLGFLINVGATTALVKFLEIPPIQAKIIGVGLAFFANFALNAVFVFQPKPIEKHGANPPQ